MRRRTLPVLLLLVVTAACSPQQQCAQEDSPGPCYWNATTQGNHVGTSFWIDSDQNIHPIP